VKAADIMTRNVLTTTEEASVAAAARLMLDGRMSGLPVLNQQGAVTGMVTEGDLLRRVEIGTDHPCSEWAGWVRPGRVADEYVHSHGRRVAEIMSSGVVCVAPNAPLSAVVELMESHHIKRIPVLDGQSLVGIVTRADVLKALVESAEDRDDVRRMPDAQLQAQLLSSIRRQPWAPRATISVAVTNGVAELAGVVTDDRARRALRVLCENTPGVSGVVDHLVWVEPISGFPVETTAV